jgi:hypothetical protein
LQGVQDFLEEDDGGRIQQSIDAFTIPPCNCSRFRHIAENARDFWGTFWESIAQANLPRSWLKLLDQ